MSPQDSLGGIARERARARAATWIVLPDYVLGMAPTPLELLDSQLLLLLDRRDAARKELAMYRAERKRCMEQLDSMTLSAQSEVSRLNGAVKEARAAIRAVEDAC